MTHFASACCTSFSGATTHQPPSRGYLNAVSPSLPSASIARRNDWVPSTTTIGDICSRRKLAPARVEMRISALMDSGTADAEAEGPRLRRSHLSQGAP